MNVKRKKVRRAKKIKVSKKRRETMRKKKVKKQMKMTKKDKPIVLVFSTFNPKFKRIKIIESS